jgi:hypothetical protein
MTSGLVSPVERQSQAAGDVSRISKFAFSSDKMSENVKHKLSVIQEVPHAVSRYGKSNNQSLYWDEHNFTAKKNAKLLGETSTTQSVVAKRGIYNYEVNKQVIQRSVRGDEKPEPNQSSKSMALLLH